MPPDKINLLLPADLEKKLKSCTNLPSLPAIALKIIDASKDPDISLHEVSEIISSDPAISAKLLKIANSPLYSQRRALNNLREALTLLGFNASLTIALSFSLQQSIGNNKSHENFWRRSILSASIARMLGSKLSVPRLEDLFLASLLQDIGVLVIQCINDSPYRNEKENLMHSDRVKFEQSELNIEHSLVSAWLLQLWKLPDYLVYSAMYSHSLNSGAPNQSDDDIRFHYCLNLSGDLADVWLNNNRGELLLSIQNVAKKVLSVNDEEFNEIIVEINEYLPDIASVFEIFLVDDKERDNVLDEARELLLARSIDTIKKSEDDKRYIDSITDRVEKIEKESRIDHLTQVYNRQHIDKLLELEYEEANINRWPLSLAFIDIDDFKPVNDTFGHLVGDEILKLIADFFSINIRETDVLARYGGDEFLLMLPGATSEIAASVINRLLVLSKDKLSLEAKDVTVSSSVSIGLATHMDKNDFNSLKEFIAAADEALYKAKHKGKNCLAIY